MFCVKCNSRIRDNAETGTCSECGPESAPKTVCDIWSGPTHGILKARHVVDRAEALKIAREALSRGYLVNLYQQPAIGRLAATLSEAAA